MSEIKPTDTIHGASLDTRRAFKHYGRILWKPLAAAGFMMLVWLGDVMFVIEQFRISDKRVIDYLPTGLERTGSKVSA